MTPTQMQFSRIVILFVLAICLVCFGGVILSFKSPLTGEQDRDTTGSSRPSESPPVHVLVEPRQGAAQRIETSELTGSASSQIYLDPVTGKIGAPPPRANALPRLLSPEEENALRSSSEGLVQIPLMGPAGGVKIDLQGRFRSEAVASIDTQSNLLMRCAPSGVSENKATHQGK